MAVNRAFAGEKHIPKKVILKLYHSEIKEDRNEE